MSTSTKRYIEQSILLEKLSQPSPNEQKFKLMGESARQNLLETFSLEAENDEIAASLRRFKEEFILADEPNSVMLHVFYTRYLKLEKNGLYDQEWFTGERGFQRLIHKLYNPNYIFEWNLI